MKYSIHISQKGIVDSKLHDKTDVIDWIIVDYIKDWFFSKNAKKIIHENEEYVWINYSYMLDDMPLLTVRDTETRRLKKLTDDAIGERLHRLEKNKVLQIIKLRDNSIYVRPTDLCRQTWFSPDSTHA